MAKLRSSFTRIPNDRVALAKEIHRFRALLDCNTDPAVTPILEGLIAEAEARLSTLENPAVAGPGA